jgi:hypothetical protein
MSQPADPPAQQPPTHQPPVQQQPAPAVQPAEQKRFRLALFLPAVLAAVAALLVGIGIGTWGGGGWGDRGGVGRTTAAPAPAVTVTETVERTVGGGGAPSEEPTAEPSTEPTEAGYNPKPTDFKIGIKVLEKMCHGQLGCDVNFQIVPSYVGSQALPAKGTTEVTYEVIGGTSTITNTFEVDGNGTMTFDEKETVEIASSSGKLVAKATLATYNEFG